MLMQDDDNGFSQVRPMCTCAVMACGVNKQILTASDGEYDDFGSSVSIDGDTVLIGAPYMTMAGSKARLFL